MPSGGQFRKFRTRRIKSRAPPHLPPPTLGPGGQTRPTVHTPHTQAHACAFQLPDARASGLVRTGEHVRTCRLTRAHAGAGTPMIWRRVVARWPRKTRPHASGESRGMLPPGDAPAAAGTPVRTHLRHRGGRLPPGKRSVPPDPCPASPYQASLPAVSAVSVWNMIGSATHTHACFQQQAQRSVYRLCAALSVPGTQRPRLKLTGSIYERG